MQSCKQKILITGGTGQLGSSLIYKLADSYDIFPCYDSASVSSSNLLDVRNYNQIEYAITSYSPDIIINCAALTNVDLNETERTLAYDVNVVGLKNIIKASSIDTKIVQISSDYVFSGEKKDYIESDLPSPLSYYGKLKLESENILRSSNRSFLIFRPSVVFSFNHNNFFTWVYTSLKKNKTIRVVDDQISNPTWVNILSEVIAKSIYVNLEGLYHFSGPDTYSRYEFALLICETFGLDTNLIKRIKTSDLKQVAKRPLLTSLNSSKINDFLHVHHPPIVEILKTFKEQNHE